MHMTSEDFEKMVQELLFEKESRFDALYLIIQKELRQKFKIWCDQSVWIRGAEEDILHDFYIKMIQNVVRCFLLNGGRTVKNYNNDLLGFRGWLHTSAENFLKDEIKKRKKKHTVSIDCGDHDDPDEVGIILPDPEDHVKLYEKREMLQENLNTVLASSSSVYKILTWLAHFVFMLCEVPTRIESNKLIIAAFENATLNDMYDMLLKAAKRIPWLKISEEQDIRIRRALQKQRSNKNITYGESGYKDFYMKKNGVADAKKSISDWTNRMDELASANDPSKKKNNKDPDKKTKSSPKDEGDDNQEERE